MSDVGFVVVACSDRSKCYPMSKPVRICNVDFTRILPVLSLHPSAKCVDVKTRVAQGNQTGDIGYTIFSWRRSVRQVPAASRLSVQVTFRLSSSSDMCARSVCCEENRYNRGARAWRSDSSTSAEESGDAEGCLHLPKTGDRISHE
jgi:hypothetical protein